MCPLLWVPKIFRVHCYGYSIGLENVPISFKAFQVEDAEKVTKAIVRSRNMDDSEISQISDLVKSNLVDGKVGIELL